MDQSKPLPNKLQMPEGVSSQGPVADLTEAYVKAIIALPENLTAIMEELVGINDSIGLLALYIEKKGMAEGTLTNEDIEGDKEDGPEKHTAD